MNKTRLNKTRLNRTFLITLTLLTSACSQSDTEQARHNLKTSGEELKKDIAGPTGSAVPTASVPPTVTAPPASFRVAFARDNAPVTDSVAFEVRPIVLEAPLRE